MKQLVVMLALVLLIPSSVEALFEETFSPERVKAEYGERPIRVMVVPGHDNEYWGTQFQDFREADLNLSLAQELYGLLSDDQRFLALTTRDFKTGEYTIPFENYFTHERDEILAFAEAQTNKLISGIQSGAFEHKESVSHVYANQDTRVRLYGINAWANHNAVDIVLHIHFNDSPDRRWDEAGSYSGFALYIPEKQLPNARLSRGVAEALRARLESFIGRSDHHLEEDTLVESQALIAVGSNASREGASLIIEYSYLYEPQIMQPQTRELLVSEMADQTYQALIDYFEESHALKDRTTLLPHTFTRTMKKGLRHDTEALRLQRALTLEGLYPPHGKTTQECPVNGTFLSCTFEAVVAFQETYRSAVLTPLGLAHGTGFVGPATLKQLNILYGD